MKSDLHTACKVDRTGRGSVVIWMVLPTRFDRMNMPIPSYIASASTEAKAQAWLMWESRIENEIENRDAHLPSSPFIWWSPDLIIVFLILK